MKRLLWSADSGETITAVACEVLHQGGVIVYPTDTIYGFGCDIFRRDALEKIFRIKGRGDRQPMSILCADIPELLQYAVLTNANRSTLNPLLPGPYTFVLKSASKLPAHIQGPQGSIGIRIPDNPVCLDLVRSFGRPISTTSVNRSGDPPANDPDRIAEEFADDIDLLIDTGVIISLPSTVVDLTGEKPVILRQGKGEMTGKADDR